MAGLSFTDIIEIAGYVGALVVLEGLLSADNALVLAIMVRHLSRRQQRRALFWGIWGAIGFRVLALSLSSILLHLWYCKVIGGLYLLYLTFSHFLFHRNQPVGDDQQPGAHGALRGFWGTVVSITVADIAFSIDSILAAVAMAEGFPARFGEPAKFYVVVTGGILGIITMRFVVKYFLMLLKRFPGLDDGAYYLVAWIGLKLFLNGLHSPGFGTLVGWQFPFHIPELTFWLGMVLIAGASMLVKAADRPGEEADVSESLDLLQRQDRPPGESGDDVPRPAGASGPRPAGEEPARRWWLFTWLCGVLEWWRRHRG
jgi:YkoY family integral membrane protein